MLMNMDWILIFIQMGLDMLGIGGMARDMVRALIFIDMVEVKYKISDFI